MASAVAGEHRRRGRLVVAMGEHGDQRLCCALRGDDGQDPRFEERHSEGDHQIHQRRQQGCDGEHRGHRDGVEYQVLGLCVVIHDRLLIATIPPREAIRA
jgi:hypothetical protein